MRLLFVADGRSPIALNWIAYFVEGGHEVHLASTFPAAPALDLASYHFVPVAFSSGQSVPASGLGGLGSRLGGVQWRTRLRQWFGPRTIPQAAQRLGLLIQDIQPELVHAMRIPYEGMLAAQALRAGPAAVSGMPLLISVWGNDFTLHGVATPWMTRLTRQTLERAGGLHADCQRDLDLALRWGLAPDKPRLLVPGNGGVRREVFHPPEDLDRGGAELVVNPRGLRAYVRNAVFFRAAARALAQRPSLRFACPAMAGDRQAEDWVEKLGIGPAVELLPKLSPAEMAELFRRSLISVSPSTHDGTPNTLLEAMACGCFPIAGDIPALREWIKPGENGLLVDPGDPGQLAGAILSAVEQPELRHAAASWNLQLVAERAEYRVGMGRAMDFYQQLLG